MRFSIRYQLLLPLVMLILGVVGISAWTAWSSARRARAQIEQHMDGVARTVRSVTFPRNLATLQLIKSLAGADFLFCDPQRRPLLDDAGRPLTTLPGVPEKLPDEGDGEADGLGTPVKVGGETYF